MPAPAAPSSWSSRGTADSKPQREDCPFTRDDEIWFTDGSVILLARDHAFKVYQGLLAHCSDVFQGLFSIPTSSSMESYEGCPILRLSDHPEELRHLLRVLINGNRYYRADAPIDFAIVATLVRLSHKYQIDDVREAYLARMKSCFCTDVTTWDAVVCNHGSSAMTYHEEDAIAAVNIAQLTGEETMLPSALFTCCLLDTRFLLDSLLRFEGTGGCLSAEGITRCINARPALFQNVVSTVMELSDHVLATSVRRIHHLGDGCRGVFLSMRQQVLYLSPEMLLRDAFSSKANTMRALQMEGRLCEDCANCYCEAEQGRLSNFWARLPQILGIKTPKDWPRE